MTEPAASVSFAISKAHSEGQSSDVARALGRCQRLAEARTRAWLARRPTRELTAALETAWADFRQARALLSADRPPADHHRVERVITVRDRRYHGRDHVLDRFLIDRCAADRGARVALSAFALELAEYATDAEERRDLPTSRQLARQLRTRGLTVTQAGPRVWVHGVRLLDRDENRQTPHSNSKCQSDGYGSSREHQAKAGETGKGGQQ